METDNLPEKTQIINLEAGGASYPLYVRGTGSSSIDLAWEFMAQGRLPLWGAVLLESQTAGRGRMGRTWQSPPGHLYGALRLPLGPPFDGAGASLALAFYLAEALEDFGWSVGLKWPNDLLLDNRKICGILLENRNEALVAGVGFNLKAPPEGAWQLARDPGAPAPGALPFTGTPAQLWSALVKKIIVLYNEKFTGLSMNDLIPLAERRLVWLGRKVRVEKPASEPPAPPSGLSGRIIGLGPEGHLRLKAVGGEYALWSGTLCLIDT